MDAWAAVLAQGDAKSDLALLLRRQLVGFRAALKSAATTRPDDPALPEVERLLAQLDILLDAGLPRASQESHATESDPFEWDEVPQSKNSAAAAPAPVSGARTFDDLQSLVRDEPRLDAMIVEDRWPPGEAGWWGAIHLAGLALDARAAQRWQDKIAAWGETPSPAGQLVCAGPEDLDLVPAMSIPGIENGLRIQPDGPLDPRIADLRIGQMGLDDTEQQLLGKMQLLVSLWLTLIGRAPAMKHCLEAVNRHGTIALDGNQRDRYEQALIRRLTALVRRADASSEERARAWVAMDEALQAVLFEPLEERTSRFAGWKRQVRTLVLQWVKHERSREPTLQVRTLPEDYAQVQSEGLTQRSDDIPLRGQRSGAVLATLRLWLRCGGRVEQGRALYGSG